MSGIVINNGRLSEPWTDRRTEGSQEVRGVYGSKAKDLKRHYERMVKERKI
jgi:hypothetical protein